MYLTIVEMAKAYDLNLYEWVMFVSYYLDQYRNYQFGIENGSEQWGDTKQLSKSLRDPKEEKNTYLSKNIAVSDTLLSNRNMLIIGGSGSYKTTSVLTPQHSSGIRDKCHTGYQGRFAPETWKLSESSWRNREIL